MGVFDDKKFEKLDWISQATEPIDSKMNEVLGTLPEVTIINFDLYKQIAEDGYGNGISINKVMCHLIRMQFGSIDAAGFSYHALAAVENCFRFEIDGDDLILDYENKTISGEIRFVKFASTMDEQILKGMLGQEGLEQINYSNIRDFQSSSRMNEIMELLTKCEEGIRTRSPHKKRSAIIRRVRQLFKDNEWNIRDTELANKVGNWISEYISYGNIAAFSNFCRLKVMTHKGQPIYSMEEVV